MTLSVFGMNTYEKPGGRGVTIAKEDKTKAGR
jgi:hypothetical protein